MKKIVSLLVVLAMLIAMVPAVFAADNTATLVTDASSLAVGDQIIIVANAYDYAIGTNQKSNNRAAAAVTKSGNDVTYGDDVQVLTLEAGTTDGTWAFNTGSGYLYAASSSSNYLRTETSLSANSSWSVSIADGVASVVAQGSNTRATLQYNPNNGSPLFACYSSASQQAVSIYKIEATTGDDTTGDDTTGGEESTVYAPVDGDKVNIYYPDGGTYLTATASGTKLTAGTVDEAIALNVAVDANGYYTFTTDGSKYLTCGATGNSLSFADAASDYSLWALEEADNGWYIKSVNAAYNGNSQYIEFYYNFTTYGFSSSKANIYTFQFVKLDATEEHQHEATVLTADAEGHYYACACGYVDPNVVKVAHTDTDANYACDATCGWVLAPDAGSVLTVVEANKLGVAHAHNTYTEGQYVVTGTVVSIDEVAEGKKDYGNLTIADEEGNTLYVYGLVDAEGKAPHADWNATMPAVDDSITITSIIGQYNGTAQAKNATFVINSAEGGDEETLPSGSITAGYYTPGEWTAPASGNVTFTETTGIGADMLTTSYDYIASVGTYTMDVVEGETYLFFGASSASEAVISWAYNSVVADGGDEGGEGGETIDTIPNGGALSVGDNNVTLNAATMPMMAASWTFTATEGGYVTVKVASVNGEAVTGVFAYGYTVYIGEEYGYGECTAYVAAGDTVTVVVTSSQAVPAVLNVAFEAGEPVVELNPSDYFAGSGTLDDPYIIETLTEPVHIFVGDNDIYYKYVAEGNGTVTFTADEGLGGYAATNCAVMVNNGDWDWSAGPATVSLGDVVIINIWGGYEGTVSLTATPGGDGNEGGEGEGGEGEEGGVVAEGTDVTVKADEPVYEIIEITTDGILSVTIGENVKYQYATDAYLLDGYWEGTWSWKSADETFEVLAGETYTFRFYCYYDWSEQDGTVSYSITFTPAEVEVQNSAYEEIGEINAAGEYTMTMVENTNMTVFVFCPNETGVYTISGDSIAKVGDMWVNIEDPAQAEWVSEIVFTCTSVGQSIVIGYTDDQTITITKTSEYEAPKEVELQTYVNNAADLALTYEPEMGDCDAWTYVDIYDMDATITAVKGEDGYYHLNSADGPVLMVDVEHIVTLNGALYEGRGVMYAYVYDEDGKLVEKWDIGAAVQEYMAAAEASETGFIPLTDDLIFFYDVYGHNSGWYMEGASIFDKVTTTGTEGDTETTVETVTFNAENAWMFACLYVETEHTYEDGVCTVCGDVVDSGDDEGDTGDGEVSEPEKTGDNTLIGLAAAAALLSAMSIVVLPKAKKFF